VQVDEISRVGVKVSTYIIDSGVHHNNVHVILQDIGGAKSSVVGRASSVVRGVMNGEAVHPALDYAQIFARLLQIKRVEGVLQAGWPRAFLLAGY